MSQLVEVLALGAIIVGMKALPFLVPQRQRSRLAETVLDLLPAGLLTALLLPPVLVGAAARLSPGSALAVLSVVVALAVARLTGKMAPAIGAGLALLALAEIV